MQINAMLPEQCIDNLNGSVSNLFFPFLPWKPCCCNKMAFPPIIVVVLVTDQLTGVFLRYADENYT